MSLSRSESAAPAALPAGAGSLAAADVDLLLVLSEAGDPMGARLASRKLAERGLELSEATVSRMLANLDASGCTQRHGAKGRTLTKRGVALARAHQRNRKRNADLAVVLDIRSIEQLIDLLYARLGVERQAARAAALRASEEDLDALQALVEDFDARRARGENPRHLAIEFHRGLARAGRNSLLTSLSDIVLGEELDYLEELLDVITNGHGSIDQASGEHAGLVDALRSRDPVAAERLVGDHLMRLIDEVESFAESERSAMFPRLIELVQSR